MLDRKKTPNLAPSSIRLQDPLAGVYWPSRKHGDGWDGSWSCHSIFHLCVGLGCQCSAFVDSRLCFEIRVPLFDADYELLYDSAFGGALPRRPNHVDQVRIYMYLVSGHLIKD